MSLNKKQNEFKNIIKLGRTHLQDAMPLSVSQELSGYCFQVSENILNLQNALEKIMFLPIGGTCVGTGVNSPLGFDKKMIKEINKITNSEFKLVKNKFSLISSHDDILTLSSSINRIALTLLRSTLESILCLEQTVSSLIHVKRSKVHW